MTLLGYDTGNVIAGEHFDLAAAYNGTWSADHADEGCQRGAHGCEIVWMVVLVAASSGLSVCVGEGFQAARRLCDVEFVVSALGIYYLNSLDVVLGDNGRDVEVSEFVPALELGFTEHTRFIGGAIRDRIKVSSPVGRESL